MTDWIDEILTPLNTEGERARGGEGEKKEKRRGLRMTDQKIPSPLNYLPPCLLNK